MLYGKSSEFQSVEAGGTHQHQTLALCPNSCSIINTSVCPEAVFNPPHVRLRAFEFLPSVRRSRLVTGRGEQMTGTASGDQ
jgi:hypothetical protein